MKLGSALIGTGSKDYFRKAAFILALAAVSSPGIGYEVATHEDLTQVAVSQSDLSVSSKLLQLGLLGLSPDDARQAFPSENGGPPRTILNLIRFGSQYEDNLGMLQAKFQPLRHFYDPVYDRALDVGGAIGVSKSVKSPDWALEDLGTYNGSPGPLAIQDHSLRDAREYLYQALTDSRTLVRISNFGLTFQSLGHIVHHLQDMAQPQHARNDPHCDRPICSDIADVLQTNQLYAPSAYEKYTDLNDGTAYGDVRPNLPFSGAGSAAVFPGDMSVFKSPRAFWRTTRTGDDISQGKGIAEYTNRGFYSAGTVNAYSSPPPRPGFTEYYSATSAIPISDLLPGTTLTGTVRFWSTEVRDMLTGTRSTNDRALSEGLLDGDLAKYYATAAPGPLVYALNRFTFDAAHKFLIPRAVGYSAGFINFFFRGQLEITPPDEGVYGIVDHTVENAPDVGGFAKIKLKVRNVTPGGVNAQGQAIVEPIPDGSTGTLVAVVKFHRNTCYTPTLSGEYGSPGIDWQTCRAPTEEIVVSAPQSVPQGINDEAKVVAFTFPNKVPINATDAYLQVVYRGPLGDEADAVVVATRDIAEPLYLSQYALWDQFSYQHHPFVEPGPYSFAEWCAQGYPSYDDCRNGMGATLKIRFGPSPGYTDAPAYAEGEWNPLAVEPPFTPVATMTAPVGTYTRVAMLADGTPRAGVFVWERINPTYSSLFKWESVSLIGNRNQLDFDTNTLVPTTTYVVGRGIYVPEANGALLNSGTVPDIPPLTPSPSQINF